MGAPCYICSRVARAAAPPLRRPAQNPPGRHTARQSRGFLPHRTGEPALAGRNGVAGMRSAGPASPERGPAAPRLTEWPRSVRPCEGSGWGRRPTLVQSSPLLVTLAAMMGVSPSRESSLHASSWRPLGPPARSAESLALRKGGQLVTGPGWQPPFGKAFAAPHPSPPTCEWSASGRRTGNSGVMDLLADKRGSGTSRAGRRDGLVTTELTCASYCGSWRVTRATLGRTGRIRRVGGLLPRWKVSGSDWLGNTVCSTWWSRLPEMVAVPSGSGCSAGRQSRKPCSPRPCASGEKCVQVAMPAARDSPPTWFEMSWKGAEGRSSWRPPPWYRRPW